MARDILLQNETDDLVVNTYYGIYQLMGLLCGGDKSVCLTPEFKRLDHELSAARQAIKHLDRDDRLALIQREIRPRILALVTLVAEHIKATMRARETA